LSVDDQPGRLVGTGRAADVYALDDQRVLRRYRTGHNAEHEAAAMRYLREAGYPVPEVYDASGPDLVMQRLDGHDMLADLQKWPWLVHRHAATLARLHDQLHAIAAPPSWRAVAIGTGDRCLHLDLHPGNVMLTGTGPVVIDWSNVAAGQPAADVALTWLIIATSEVDDLSLPLRLALSTIRRRFLARFLARAAHDPGGCMAEAARYRMRDPNVRPAEAEKLKVIEAAAERDAGGREATAS
jgi:aminoglycoside phosphotransferase (APT) family kinase protein